VKKLRRNNQQVRLERREAHSLQRQCKVAVGGRKWNVVRQTNDVQWPQVIVAQALPQEARGDGFAVVHASFRWVVAYYSVD